MDGIYKLMLLFSSLFILSLIRLSLCVRPAFSYFRRTNFLGHCTPLLSITVKSVPCGLGYICISMPSLSWYVAINHPPTALIEYLVEWGRNIRSLKSDLRSSIKKHHSLWKTENISHEVSFTLFVRFVYTPRQFIGNLHASYAPNKNIGPA